MKTKTKINRKLAQVQSISGQCYLHSFIYTNIAILANSARTLSTILAILIAEQTSYHGLFFSLARLHKSSSWIMKYRNVRKLSSRCFKVFFFFLIGKASSNVLRCLDLIFKLKVFWSSFYFSLSLPSVCCNKNMH